MFRKYDCQGWTKQGKYKKQNNDEQERIFQQNKNTGVQL